MRKIAIIGGTGWDEEAVKSTFENSETRIIHTAWGDAKVVCLSAGDRDLFFMHRHVTPANNAHVPPHRINYRANIAALHALGAQHIFATTAVGSLHPDWLAGSFALIEQIIDFTSGRKSTFHDDDIVHTDMTAPYDATGTALLQKIGARHQLPLHTHVTYICTNGPRFETTAEIRLFARWGADVVGMTGMPEVALARELALPYSAISVITNAAAGISPTPLTHQEVTDCMQIALPQLKELLLEAAAVI